MGYNSLINGQLKKAFTLMKDLVDVVVLSHSTATFNFATGTVTNGAAVDKSIKGLLITKKRQSTSRNQQELGNTKATSYIFQAQDLSDPTIYDTITLANGDVYRMVPPYENDGFLITVNVTKEA
jgi:hypothetical protein